jgi:threonine/homoserine/homoserine lactone efflux protein
LEEDVDPAMFVRGVLIGLSVAAPVGPMGVLCIRRTLADGRLIGLATGLGVATADAIYGGIAGFGITVISNVLLRAHVWIRLIGGLFLCYLGLRTIVAVPPESAADEAGPTRVGAYTSAVALTLTNPMTILTFTGIFAGVGAGTTGRASGTAAMLVLGVLVGSALWWVFLSNMVALVRTRLTPPALRWINRLSGGILLGFGLLALVSLL